MPGTLFVAHALKIAELHTGLCRSQPQQPIELIELAGETASRRSYGGPLGPRVLKPTASFGSASAITKRLLHRGRHGHRGQPAATTPR